MDVALASLNAAQAGSAKQRDLECRIQKLEADVKVILKLLQKK